MAALGRGARLPLLSPLAHSLHRAPLAPFFVFPKAALATSALRCLRKPATRKGTFLGVERWYFLDIAPLRALRAMAEVLVRRITGNTRLSTMDDAARHRVLNKTAKFYALMAWTAVGVGFIAVTRPKTEEQKAWDKEHKKTPYEEAREGSALWWVSTLKTPEQLQNTQGITVYRQKGFSLEKEDITLQSKEMGQRIKESMTGGSQTGTEDIYLRKYIGVKQVRDGGPSNEQLRADMAAEGKNYELHLDWANRAHGVRTRCRAPA